MAATLQSLPVLMYHYVSNFPNSIAVSPALFEDQCRVLAESGWRGVSLDEAEEFLLTGETLPPKSCLFTFDDGYLDNYVYAEPLLRKYGHHGVVFAVLERLEGPSAAGGEAFAPRKTLADVWSGSCAPSDLPPVDNPVRERPEGYHVREDYFLRWSEARRVDADGALRVAAHSLRHEWVYAGEAFEDFFAPAEQNRTFYRCAPAQPWGMPLFAVRRELTGPAFVPHEALLEAICRLVPQNESGAHAFFSGPEAKTQLRNAVEAVRLRYGALGRMETPQETHARYARVMQGCAEILRAELGHSVQSFCWPWGVFAEEARMAGLDAGFRVFFTTEYGVNPPGEPLAVRRFKAKSKPGAWLRTRLGIYSRPWLGRLYTKMRL